MPYAFLIYRALPGFSGIRFGSAASALWPGYIAAQLMDQAAGPTAFYYLYVLLPIVPDTMPDKVK
jgi:hypothetical protein